MAGFDDTLRKFASLATQRDRDFTAAAAAQPGFHRSSAMAFAIGARVFDLVTGETGTVINGKRESITLSTARSNGSGNGVRETK